MINGIIFKENCWMKNEIHVVENKFIKDDVVNLAYEKPLWKASQCWVTLEQYHLVWNTMIPRRSCWDTTEMVTKALVEMKKRKGTGTSGLNVKMILSGAKDIIIAIVHHVNCVAAEAKFPNDWTLSYIINCYRGKGDTLLKDNYRDLKLLYQVVRVVEPLLVPIMRTQIDINAMQFDFMPGRGTSYAIFIIL